MAEMIIPEIYTRKNNTDHNGQRVPISPTKKFSYGTAGFRTNAAYLPFVVFRVGYLAGIRARHLDQTIGIMITASHNPIEDNGVKIIDPMGGMLDATWENYANLIVNASDSEFLEKSQEFRRQFSGRIGENANVFTAIDTRPSSKYIEEAAFNGIQCARVRSRRLGLLTTPQLHYIVRCQNDSAYGIPTETGYYAKVQNALAGLNFVTRCGKEYTPVLYLDCANGVGAQKFAPMCIGWPTLVVNLMNTQEALLNDQCGADYIKLEKKFPRNFDKIQAFERCAAFDGDVDRLVYFYRDASNEFVLIDGDKIAALFAKYIKEQINGAGLNDIFTVSVIQTGYANGNSTKFLKDEMGIHVSCVATGIKNLQKEAIKYDIAVYFEANGHGTVYFSPRFYDIIRTIITHKDEVDQKIEIERLLCFSKLLNTVVGDAMTDLLAVEMLLKHYDWTIENWNSMYKELPSVQRKLKIMNRSAFQMNNDETMCVKPRKLQEIIDTVVAKYCDGRSFVRPSGTEDVVRIYAEAKTEHDAKAIANEVEVAIYEMLYMNGNATEEQLAERHINEMTHRPHMNYKCI
ncbi:phosphoglucomutase/phosphomannomutase, alpha/beta/alpha domain I [Onchocerca flexuosa]|uniref:Phosphoacetylglucosamine mutase n=1 Tax=Onchocerca flexuosa TaxID=387005 RepID=A0A238BZP9_9BILA|nr:phosphoglucomutase/phosphomannomutase, alpha/beta/alpha domain I [Onchocerca flexuosa]